MDNDKRSGFRLVGLRGIVLALRAAHFPLLTFIHCPALQPFFSATGF